MTNKEIKPANWLVILAFIILYLVWGSTYLFIVYALESFPTTILGFFRFSLAGLLMLIYCVVKKEKIFDWNIIRRAGFVGILLLFAGNGGVVFAENTISSSLAAIIVSAAPIWFVLLDKRMWAVNFKDKSIIYGLLIGFIGVIMLFYDSLSAQDLWNGNGNIIWALIIIMIGCFCWSIGSVYNKYNSIGSSALNIAWQMIAAALAYGVASFISGEAQDFHRQDVSMDALLSLLYLVIFGSIAGYTAYIWLLKVRPITQVSTYAYVNPVVAVMLGVVFANEVITPLQYLALSIILGSILLINLNKYRKAKNI